MFVWARPFIILGYYDAAEARRGVAVGPFFGCYRVARRAVRGPQAHFHVWQAGCRTKPQKPSNNRETTVGYTFWTTLVLFAQNGDRAWWQNPIVTIFLPIGVLFWFLLIRPQQRAKQQRQLMLGALKKNDHVITVGGIYGVVTNVHREADEVTIKVDEAANVKLRVTLGSIARVSPDQTARDSSS